MSTTSRTMARTAALLGTAALTAGGLAVAVAAPANADVDREGRCGGAQYDFSVDRDDDRRNSYEVSADLDARPGDRFRVVLRQNGNAFVNRAFTADREGDVEIDRDRANTRGQDRFVMAYTNLATDRTCRVVVRVA